MTPTTGPTKPLPETPGNPFLNSGEATSTDSAVNRNRNLNTDLNQTKPEPNTPYRIQPAKALPRIASAMLANDPPTELATSSETVAESHQEGDHKRARYVVVRSGERAEIPRYVRTAVGLRDRGKCELCGFPVPENTVRHLDHITPWSAGGSDDSTNLRTTCEPCNVERSNFVTLFDRPRLPVTWWCINCFTLDEQYEWEGSTPVVCPVHPRAYDGTYCRVIAGMKLTEKLTGERPTWFDRPPIEDFENLTVAYCAHCDAVAQTAYPL